MSIIIFVKYPKPKNVKTRLGKTIGYNEAAELYSCFVKDIILEVKKTDEQYYIFYDENSKENEISNWLGSENNYHKQSGDDLGQKMSNAFELIFDKYDHNKAILIGSDIPSIKSKNLSQALSELEKSDSIIGPGFDGGYYLIGSKQEKFHSKMFRNIKWSTETVLKKSIDNIFYMKNSLYLLGNINDIDEYTDLEQFYNENRISMRNSYSIKYIENKEIVKEK